MDDRYGDITSASLVGQSRGKKSAAGNRDRFLFFIVVVLVIIFLLEALSLSGILSQGEKSIDFFVSVISLLLLFFVFRRHKEWKDMAAELTRTRDFTEEVLICAPPLCITSPDFSILYVNCAYLDIFHPGGDRLPRHCYDSRPGKRCRSASCPLEQIKSGRSEAVCEARKTMPDGGERDFMISARPFLSLDGKLAGAVAVFADVTRLKRLEEKVRIHRHLEGLATLAGGMAHDFNNLLTVVFGNQEMAAAMSTAPEVRKVLAESSVALAQARELSARLLIMADSGIDSTREVGNLVPLAERSFREGLGDYGLRVTFDPGSDLPRVSFAPAQMKQAFSSLGLSSLERMTNSDSILFRSRGVESGEDNELGLEPGTWLSIWIIEQGKGLEPAVASRIFEPYYSPRPMNNQKGRGLGMALAYAVISRHGGMVLVSSGGEGFTVRIMLPAAGPVPREEPHCRFHPVASGKEAVGELFILEDDETVADILAEMVGHLGYASRSFTRGEELVEVFAGLEESQRPLMILVDLLVPRGLGGIATLRSLQEIAPGVRVMAVSGQSSDEIMERPRKFGFAAALKKPFDFEELEKGLAATLAGIGKHVD